MAMDSDKLRKDLVNYYGTAMFSGHPMARMDLIRVESAAPKELVKIAQQNKIDVNKYSIPDVKISMHSNVTGYKGTDVNYGSSEEVVSQRTDVGKKEMKTDKKNNETFNEEILVLQNLIDELESNYSFFEKKHKDNFEYIKNNYKRLYVLEEIQTELVEKLQIEAEKKDLGKKERIWRYEAKKADLELIRQELKNIKEQYECEKAIFAKEQVDIIKEKEKIQAKINQIKRG